MIEPPYLAEANVRIFSISSLFSPADADRNTVPFHASNLIYLTMDPARSSEVLNTGDQAPQPHPPPPYEHAGSTPPQTSERRQAAEMADGKGSPLLGYIDVERQCGVPLREGRRCGGSLACKRHSMSSKRAVAGRSAPLVKILFTLRKTLVQQDGAREGFHGGGVPQSRTRTFVLYYLELLRNRPTIFTPSMHVEQVARAGIAPADVEKLKRITRRHFHIVCDAATQGGRHGS
ncbi:hypothetical protein CSIM01_11279 [Colletotrichum simmondsii]|uniref:SCA7 domain-containing protein n=1 Tax=Colletotrichum simmondsii TaxID=703756 RepID=A0A135TWY2_9PEZI|nr:hypothetical protein CSIM01_11279 [Colletotrichum simmondsii]